MTRSEDLIKTSGELIGPGDTGFQHDHNVFKLRKLF